MPTLMRPSTEGAKHLHGFAYGKSRVGKTTLGIHFHKAGFPLLVVTMEPGPVRAAMDAAGVTDAPIMVPADADDLFLFLEYQIPYLDRHLNSYRPGMVLLDNIRGLQTLLIGEPERKAQTIDGIKIEAQAATGLMRLPNSRDAGAPGLPAFKDYRILDRETRRLLRCVDGMEYHTLITAHEDLDYDAKTRLMTAGLEGKQAAGKPRVISGFPSMEGFETKKDIPGLISGPFLHMTRSESGRYQIWTQSHDEWFADGRGINATSANPIDWTDKDGCAILVGGRTK